MFKNKSDYLYELFMILPYALSKSNYIVFDEGKYESKKTVYVNLLFGISKQTYYTYMNQCKKNSKGICDKIINKMNKYSFAKVKREESDKLSNELKEEQFVAEIKKVLNDYKNDFGYNTINLEKINAFSSISSLYEYVFCKAYEDNENMLIIKPNLSDLGEVLLKKLEIWKQKNHIIADNIHIIQSESFLKITLNYFFSNDVKKNFNKFYVYVYTGIDLANDFAKQQERNGIFNSNDSTLSLICIFNPYYNYINSEKYLPLKYFTFIKQKHILANVKDFVICNKEDCILLNQLSQAIIFKIEKYFNIVIKNFIYKNENIYEHCLINQYLSKMELILHNDSICLKNERILFVGEYDINWILEYGKYYNEIYVFSNSWQYLQTLEEQYNTHSHKYIDLNLKTSLFYLGIADSVISDKREFFDTIIVGNGNGSFLNKVNKYFTYFNYVLKKSGLLIFTVFNPLFNIDGVSLTILNEHLLYTTKEDKIYCLCDNNDTSFCRINDYNYIKRKLGNFFKVNREIGFPLISLVNVASSDITIRLKLEMDIAYIKDNIEQNSQIPEYSFNLEKGYFLTYVCNKVENNFTSKFYNSIEKMSKNNSFKYDVVSHSYFFNKTVLKNYLVNACKIKEKDILKVLILKDLENEELIVLVTFYGKFLENNEQLIGQRRCKLLTIKELNEYGIEVGNISPFIDCDDLVVQKYYDELLNISDEYYSKKNIDEKEKKVVYFGSNECSKTYYCNINSFVNELKKRNFKSIII